MDTFDRNKIIREIQVQSRTLAYPLHPPSLNMIWNQLKKKKIR